MDLLLWRHAEALAARAGEPDLARALTARGERQARRMAAWLGASLPAAARILASPALRTRQTAQALGRPFETLDALAPDASVEAVLRAVRWPDAGGTVVVVGHQPTLGQVAAQLLSGAPQPWAVKKGAVWWLRCGDGGTVRLHAVREPGGA